MPGRGLLRGGPHRPSLKDPYAQWFTISIPVFPNSESPVVTLRIELASFALFSSASMDLIRNAFGGSTSAMSGNAVPLIQEHRSEGSVRGPNISMNLPSDEAADLSPSPNSHQSVAEDTNQDQNAENDEPPPLASDTEWSTDEEDSDGSMPTLQTVSDSSDLDSDVSDSEEESDWGGGEHDSDRDVAHSEEEWEDENEDVPEEWRIIMDEAFSMALNREGRIAGADVSFYVSLIYVSRTVSLTCSS